MSNKNNIFKLKINNTKKDDPKIEEEIKAIRKILREAISDIKYLVREKKPFDFIFIIIPKTEFENTKDELPFFIQTLDDTPFQNAFKKIAALDLVKQKIINSFLDE